MLKRIIPENLRPFYFMVAGSLVFYAIGYSLSFIASVLITRHLGPEGRGIYTSLTSVIGLGAILAQVGMSQVNKKLAAENKDIGSALFFTNIIICLSASIIIIPILYWLSLELKILEHNKPLLYIGLFFIPIIAIAASCGEILVGMQRSKQYNGLFIIEKTMFTALIIIGGMANSVLLSPIFVFVAFCLSQILRIVLCGFFLQIKFSLKHIRKIEVSKLNKELILANYFVLICFSAGYQVLPLLLNYFSSLQEVGFYAAARTIQDTLMVFPILYSSYAINKLIAEKSHHSYKKLKLILVLSIVVSMAGISGFFYLVSSRLIPLIFGSSFIMAVPCLKHMLPSTIFLSGYYMINSILLAERKFKAMIFLAFIHSLMPSIISFIISPKLDAVIVSYSYSIGSAITFFAAVLLDKTPLPISFARKRTGKING